MKNKNRNLLMGLVVMLLVTTTSLAYFTDVKGAKLSANAGTVTLKDAGKAFTKANMVPGDVFSVTLANTYTGNVPAKARIKFHNAKTSVDSTATEGFRLEKKGVQMVAVGETKYTDLEVLQPNAAISEAYTVHLPKVSSNKYQNSTYSVDYEIQVGQDGNTGTDWVILEAGTIVAK